MSFFMILRIAVKALNRNKMRRIMKNDMSTPLETA